METAYNLNIDVTGVEYNDFALHYVRQTYKYNVVHYSEYEKLLTNGKLFDAIFILDVIEHLVDPARVISNCYQLLAPEGLLVLVTMDMGGLVPRILGTKFEDLRRVDHLYFFSRKSLKKFLKQNNFNVIKTGSFGHNISKGAFLQKLKLNLPFGGNFISYLCNILLAGRKDIYINPLTKMLVIATKMSIRPQE